MNNKKLTHLTTDGRANMVDISHKAETKRTAVARGEVHLSADTVEIIRANLLKKGDVLTVAQLAGIMGAKKTSEIIPLCHPLNLTQIDVKLAIADNFTGVEIIAAVSTTGQTGVEMEALSAVSAAALTVYDMVKAVEKTGHIHNIRLVEKHGGKSGDFYQE